MRKIFVVGLILLLSLSAAVFAQHRTNYVIVNNTGYEIYAAYVSSSTNPNWGEDLLSTTIPPGGTRNMWTTSSVIDIMLVDVDGDSYTKFGIRVTNGARIVFTISDLDE